MKTFPQACLVVFAKEPVAGEVKTRLIPALGEQGAKDIHLLLIKLLLTKLQHFTLCDRQLWVNKNPDHSAFKQFQGERKLQSGKDLGQKMSNAAEAVLNTYKSVVIIGSDCPLMDEDYLEKAFEALTQYDVVLGPAEDGGYVLIGLNNSNNSIFQKIDWGSDKVLEQTQDRLLLNHLTWFELPTLFDIDRPEDLKLI